MLRRLGKLFGKRGVLVPGAEKLLEGESRKVDIGDPLAGGTQVLVCRVGGEVHVLDTECPHEGGRIVPGPLQDGHTAVCPLHNYRFDVRDGKAALFGAVGLGLANAFVRPLILMLTLPITVLTLGLSIWVVNALMLMLAAAFVDGFKVRGFMTALWGSAVLGLMNFLVSMVF